jgi:hypothetical protein
VRTDMGSAFVACGEGAGRFFGRGSIRCVASGVHASHAGAGEVAQPGPLACASQGNEVHGFLETTWSADVSRPRGSEKFAWWIWPSRTEHLQQRATQEHRWPEHKLGQEDFPGYDLCCQPWLMDEALWQIAQLVTPWRQAPRSWPWNRSRWTMTRIDDGLALARFGAVVISQAVSVGLPSAQG